MTPPGKANDANGDVRDGAPQDWASLQRLCVAAIRIVPVDGAAVVAMTAEGNSDLVFASDLMVRQLEEVQFDLGEGPTIDAFREGFPVLLPNLAGDSEEVMLRTAWPAFSRAARELGAGALFALPLQFGAIRVGVLLLYRTAPDDLDTEALARALRLADAITYALLGLTLDGDGHDWPRSVIDSLEGSVLDEGSDGVYRAVVHQATGVLAVQLGVGLDVALARLRGHAFAEGVALSEVARSVVAGELRLEE